MPSEHMSTHEDFVLFISVQRVLNKFDDFVKPLSNVRVRIVANRDAHDHYFIPEILAHVYLDGRHDVCDAESF